MGCGLENVLIVSSSDKGIDVLTHLLRTGTYCVTHVARSGGEAFRCSDEADFRIIIINTPLTDEFGTDLAVSLSKNTTAGIIILVKSEIIEDVSLKLEPLGILVVGKPVNRNLFMQAVNLAEASGKRIELYRNENIKLRTKIEELKIVNRAKCALIQYLNITEREAHRYIEKQAMDLRLTRREIAENIIKTYEM